jgi:hypothetical protein
MSRPLLGNLAPSVTAFTVPNAARRDLGRLHHHRQPEAGAVHGDQLRSQLRMVLRPDALFSIAVFDKEIESFPQTSSTRRHAGRSSRDPASASWSRVQASSPARHDHGQPPPRSRPSTTSTPTVVRHPPVRDAPGGYIRGVEINYQQNLTFLPWYFENLGIQANYTHLESELNYILTPPAVTTPGHRRGVRSRAPRRTPSTSRSTTTCRQVLGPRVDRLSRQVRDTSIRSRRAPVSGLLRLAAGQRLPGQHGDDQRRRLDDLQVQKNIS